MEMTEALSPDAIIGNFSLAAEGFVFHRRTLAVLNPPLKIRMTYNFRLFFFCFSFFSSIRFRIFYNFSLISCFTLVLISITFIPSSFHLYGCGFIFFTYSVFFTFYCALGWRLKGSVAGKGKILLE